MRFNPQHIAMVKQGMDLVVNSQHGTAWPARIKEPGFSMGGKTGTAQVKRITESDHASIKRSPRGSQWLLRFQDQCELDTVEAADPNQRRGLVRPSDLAGVSEGVTDLSQHDLTKGRR